MDKNKQINYARRISQANRTELLVIVYELILEEMKDAADLHTEGDFTGFHHSLQQVQRYLSQLMGTLDYSYKISANLLSLYEYVQRIIVKCDVKQSVEQLDEAASIIERLCSSYKSIIPTDTTGPVMENTQSIYAGLTYKKGRLSEFSVDAAGSGRGFLA